MDAKPLAGRCRVAANKALAGKTCNVSVRTTPTFAVTIQDEPPFVLTSAERAAATAAALAVGPARTRQRTLAALRTDINALTTAQKTAVWTALTTGSPSPLVAANGPNAAALFVLHFVATTSTLLPAEAAEARVRAIALYVRDEPLYLVNPPFAPAINIPGLELIP